nr:zinc ribbon domain-containing protein [Streptomyces sp. NBC_00899]
MSYCPACGNPVSDTSARFCMKCGRELPAPPPPAPPAAPPAPPAAPPTPTYAAPPPAYAPTASYPAAPPPQGPPQPAQPSPAGLFLRRVLAGRWDGAVLAALVPALVLLVVSGALGSWSQHAFRGSAIGWFKRSRLALTLAVQGLGGHVSVGKDDVNRLIGSNDSDCSDYYDDDGYSDDDYGTDYDSGSDYSGDMCGSGAGSASLSVVPLTFTLLWIVALVLVLRSVRRRPGGTGPEAAVRVALLSAAAATVLAFVAQPSIEGVTLHSGPFRVLLWSFLISLVTAMVVLNGPALRARFAAAARVVGAAATALVVTVLFAGVVVFVIALANVDNGVTGDTLVMFGTVLPNLGLSGLALGWGAPLRAKETGTGSHAYDVSFGLSELSHIWNGWATVLAVLGGVVCALAIGLLASARARDRAEQFAVAGVFTVMFTVLVSIGGIASGGTGVATVVGGALGPAGSKVGSAMPESLLFALLWSVGGVLAAPYVRRVLGMAPAPAGDAAARPSPYAPPPFPYVPQQQRQQSPQPQQSAPEEVHDLGIVQPDRLSKDDSTRRDEGGGRHQ